MLFYLEKYQQNNQAATDMNGLDTDTWILHQMLPSNHLVINHPKFDIIQDIIDSKFCLAPLASLLFKLIIWNTIGSHIQVVNLS